MSGTPRSSTPPPGSQPVWGSYGAGGAGTPSRPPQPTRLESLASGGGQLEPFQRRLLQVVALLSVLLLAVLLNSFLNDGGSSPGGLALNPVASAAERVEDDLSGRMSLYIVYSSPALPGPLTASGSAAYNVKTDRSRLTLSVNNPFTGEPMRTVQISEGEVEYDSGSTLTGELPPGKKWVRTEKGGDDDSELSFEEAMGLISSSPSTKLIGRESINGKMTRHYRGEITLDDVVDFLREKGKVEEAEAYEQIQGVAPTQIRAEGWVDGKNLLRRMRIVMPMPGDAGEPPMTIDMRMDFFAFGSDPDIQLPDPDTVVDGPIEDEEDAPSSASIS